MSDPHHLPDEPDAQNVVVFRKRPAAKPRPPEPTEEETDEDRARRRTNLAALVFAAILVVVGWLLVQKLSHNSRTEDCLMSGRTNCAPIDAPGQE